MLFPLSVVQTSRNATSIWCFRRDEVLCLFVVSLAQLLATSMQVGQKLNLTKRNLLTSTYIRCYVLHVVLGCLSKCDITISQNIAAVGRSTQPILLLYDAFQSTFNFLSYLRSFDLVKACAWVSCESQNKYWLCLYMRLSDSL
jgi:hypothetical protein